MRSGMLKDLNHRVLASGVSSVRVLDIALFEFICLHRITDQFLSNLQFDFRSDVNAGWCPHREGATTKKHECTRRKCR